MCSVRLEYPMQTSVQQQICAYKQNAVNNVQVQFLAQGLTLEEVLGSPCQLQVELTVTIVPSPPWGGGGEWVEGGGWERQQGRR